MKLRTKRDSLYEITVGDARILVSPISRAELREINAKYTRKKLRGGQMIEERDDWKISEEIFIRTVKDWENVFDEEGNPLPCTDETKRLVMDLNPGFALEIMDQVNQIQSISLVIEEKN